MAKKVFVAASALALAVSSAFAQGSLPGSTGSSYQLATLDPVVVTASRFEEPLASASTPVSVIDREEISRSGASNIVEFLDGVAGITASRLYGRLGIDAGVDIGFLGGDSARNVLVLIDGQRVNNVNNETVRFAQIPISSIERIEIRRAGGGVLYGDRALGGVINVITRNVPTKEASIGIGSYGYGKLEGSIASQVGQSIFGVDAMQAQVDGYRDRSNQRQQTARVHGTWRGKSNSLNLQFRGYDEDNQLPGSITYSSFLVNPKQAQAQTLEGQKSGLVSTGSYTHYLGERSELRILATHENSKNYAKTVFGPDHRETKKVSLQPSILLGQAGSSSLLTGLDYFNGENKNLSGLAVTQESMAGFISGERYLTHRLSLAAGLRWQQFTNKLGQASNPVSKESGTLNAESLGVGYRWAESHRSLAGYSRNFRFATTEELYYFNSALVPTAVNPNVKPMRSKELYFLHRYSQHDMRVEAHVRNIKTIGEIDFDFRCSQGPNLALDSCNSNLYDTERNILSLVAQFVVARGIKIIGSADFVDAKILSGPNASKSLPLVPKRSYRAAVEGGLDSGHRLVASANYRSSMFASGDPGNAYRPIQSRTIFDLGLISSATKAFRYSAWVRNFTDKRYFDFAYGAADPFVFPADPRTFEINIAYRFD